MEELTAKEISIEQEERVAKIIGGTRTPRSGGGAWKKGDVLSTDDSGWFVECKTTVKPSLSYSVNKAVLDKADHERAEMHKQYAALAFTLGEDREDYFVINSRTLKAIISQQAAIKDLATRVQDSITEIDRRRAEMTKGIATLSAAEEASYSAHRAEKQAFLEELAKLI